jgi:DNA-binding SARP family transcriptional activator
MTTTPAVRPAGGPDRPTRTLLHAVPTQTLRLRLLGGFRAEVGGRVVGAGPWRLRKACTLVKLLALAPQHRLAREQALDLLWPDLPPAAAANNLRGAIHVARQALAGAEISTDGRLLALPTAATDVAEFEAAADLARRRRDPDAAWQAVDLYTGDLLPEDRYEDWLAEPREALRATYQALLLLLARLEGERGQAADAIAALERLVAHDPLHERAHRDLMRLYLAAGQRVRALRQYERLREAMRRDLDLEPDAATHQLYRAVRAGDRAGAASDHDADAVGPGCYTVGETGGG